MNDEKIWELHQVKQQISDLQKQVRILEGTRSDLEEEVMDELNDAGLSLARTQATDENGKRVTVSINSEIVANVTDWAEFEQYVYDNNALYLLQRRASNPSYREEVAAKGNIPGVESFNKQKLSLKHV
jgi:hypothetical protein